MESLISSEPIAAQIHESIDKRAWWGMLILPCVGYVAYTFMEGYAVFSIGSVAWSILFLDPLLKISSLLDNLDLGFLNSNEFSDEINACFDANYELTTKIEIKNHADTLNNIKAMKWLIIVVQSLTLLTTIIAACYWIWWVCVGKPIYDLE